MRAHTACKEFRHSHSVGALPLETPTVVFLQRLHPNNRDTPSSGHRLAIPKERVVITLRQPFGCFASANGGVPKNFKEPGRALSFGQIP